MNYAKSNIPLMRMGDVGRTLKRTFKVKPGRQIELKKKNKRRRPCDQGRNIYSNCC